MVKGGGYTRLGPLVKDEILAFRYREGRKIEARTLRWWNNRGTTVEQDQPVTLHGTSKAGLPPPFFFLLYLSSLFLALLNRDSASERRLTRRTMFNNFHEPSRAESIRVEPSRAESALVVIDFDFLCLSSCIERSTHARVIADL